MKTEKPKSLSAIDREWKAANKPDYSVPFLAGWNSSETGAANPHLLTSNNSDAFILGRFARTLGFPAGLADTAKKSTGYKWKLGASTFVVHGRSVSLVSCHPVLP